MWATCSTAMYQFIGCWVVGMSSVFLHTRAGTILYPFSLWITFKALPPPTFGLNTLHEAHVHTPAVAPRYTNHIYNSYSFLSFFCHLHIITLSLSLIPFTVTCICDIKMKAASEVLTLPALKQTNWLANKVRG